MAWIGSALPRREDDRLLRGRGRFVDDIRLMRECHAVFVRSPHAHAAIERLDASAAADCEGLLAVYTADDVARWRLGSLPCAMRPQAKPGTRMNVPPRPALAADHVRHVGEAVAMVVAETAEGALDAAEAIEVDYAPLDPVVDVAAAATPGAPRVHEDAPENLCLVWEKGDATAVARGFAQATHVVRLSVRQSRMLPNPLEPRAAIGDWEAPSGRMILYTASQGVHDLRTQLARDIFRVPETAIRVITPDVGGSFGLKMYLFPEHVMVMAAARALERPVRWSGSRTEGFQSDNHARDQVNAGELALSREGDILALRVDSTANMGAYLSGFGPAIPTEVGSASLTGPYRTPAIHVEVRNVFTNTAPVDAYRGAGRPEGTFLVERLLDQAARQCGFDRAALRRRNLIPTEAMPYTTPLAQVYDSGDFPAVLDEALADADWAGFAHRRKAIEASSRLAGIGIACFVEPAGGRRSQRVDLRFHPDGTLTALVGAQSTGMGHETSLAQVVADGLRLPSAAVRVVEGDSDTVPFGRWTSGSRSAVTAGTALWQAADKARLRLREIAAAVLEAAPADVEFGEDGFAVRGTDLTLSMQETIVHAFTNAGAAPGDDVGIDQSMDFLAGEGTYPNGCHICEVAVDPETGIVCIERYTAVDDFGRVINPIIVDGQLHGGLAQGIGQALFEGCIYDPESGQLLTGSFLDYTMPRADDLPDFAARRLEIPCTSNPLGLKGCGEAGAIGAPPAVISAVLDALSPLGVRDIAMPATPQAVWLAIAAAKSQRKDDR